MRGQTRHAALCTLAWLAPFFVFMGYSAQQSGLMLSYMTAFEVATGLLLPIIAARHHDLRPWLLLTLAANLVGITLGSWLVLRRGAVGGG